MDIEYELESVKTEIQYEYILLLIQALFQINIRIRS